MRLPAELIVRDSCGGRQATIGSATSVASSRVNPLPGARPAHRERQKEDL